MRFFLISLLSLFFLSGCEEKDPAEEFIGKWNYVGHQKGIVIQKDGKGFMFGYSDYGTLPFTWTLEEDSGGPFLDIKERARGLHELRFDGAYLKSSHSYGSKSRIFERAK